MNDQPKSMMGVTDNARLLLGYVAGLLMRDRLDDDGSYEIDSVDAERGTQSVRHARTGNRYSIAIQQLEGTE